MSRKLLMMMAASLTVTACDPFQLVEPRPDYRRTPPPRQMPPSERWNAPDDMRRADDPQPEVATQPPGWNSGDRSVTGRYPVAQRTEIPGRVISPHPPYNVIDVSEFQSGQLVRDPTSNDEIFRVP